MGSKRETFTKVYRQLKRVPCVTAIIRDAVPTAAQNNAKMESPVTLDSSAMIDSDCSPVNSPSAPTRSITCKGRAGIDAAAAAFLTGGGAT